MTGLDGLRVALLEARMSSEIANLIRKAGGEPVSAPAVRESPLESRAPVAALLAGLSRNEFAYIIFLTGVGVKALFAEAEALGRLPELLESLRRLKTVCRGPKPVAVLKRHAVPIALTAPEPNTTTELIQTLSGEDLGGKKVALLHYGERNAPLTGYLHSRGATLTELTLYEWLMPEDTAPLRALVEAIVAGQVDAAAFTSQIQVRHLFKMAAELGQAEAMKDALTNRMIVASVGPTCTATLREHGLEPAVAPEHPKIGHLVAALVEYVERQRSP